MIVIVIEAPAGASIERLAQHIFQFFWGSCNPQTARIWINLELVKKPPECLEFIVVHELVHLHERKHNERFIGLMSIHLPNWREHRAKLNKMPLAYNHWAY